jgi:cell division protein FtsQ
MPLKQVAPLETTLRRKRRMRMRNYFKVLFLMLFVITVGGIFALNADAFKVKIVEVAGAKRVSAEKIYEGADITIGENMFTIPVGEIRENIIEQYPLVKNATVHRIVPSRVRIKIEERQPFACITDNQKYYIIDNERIVLEKPQGRADGNLFIAVTDGIRHAQIGEKLVFPHYALLARMKSVMDEAMKGKYRHVMFNSQGIKIYLLDGTYILLGDGKDMEKKIMLAPVIINKLKERNEKYEGLNLVTLEVPSYIKKENTN